MHYVTRFVIHHVEVVASRPNPDCCIPLCRFLAVIQLISYQGREAEKAT
jgi:hypothetical protein